MAISTAEPRSTMTINSESATGLQQETLRMPHVGVASSTSCGVVAVLVGYAWSLKQSFSIYRGACQYFSNIPEYYAAW